MKVFICANAVQNASLSTSEKDTASLSMRVGGWPQSPQYPGAFWKPSPNPSELRSLIPAGALSPRYERETSDFSQGYEGISFQNPPISRDVIILQLSLLVL